MGYSDHLVIEITLFSSLTTLMITRLVKESDAEKSQKMAS